MEYNQINKQSYPPKSGEKEQSPKNIKKVITGSVRTKKSSLFKKICRNICW